MDEQDFIERAIKGLDWLAKRKGYEASYGAEIIFDLCYYAGREVDRAVRAGIKPKTADLYGVIQGEVK